MRFENPAMLYLLVLPILTAGMLFFGIWSRKRVIARFGTKKTVENQLTRPSPYLRASKGICLVLGVGALIFAAARPQYGGRIRMLKKTGIDIVVALDFSKSMLAQDTPPSRIERAKLELAEFINQLTGDRIGLVAFAGDTMRFPLTTDYAAATAFWKDLNPYDMPVGGTAIGKAITAATRMLRPETEQDNETLKARSKAIVLITDGEDHFGDPLEAAKEAAKQNIVIHTVGIGSDSPELIPRYLEDGTTMGYQKNEEGEYITTALTKENEETLREIAATTSGRYFKAGRNFSGMTAVVEEIRKMKQSDIESRQQEVYEDVFQWFLIPAFTLLLLAFVLPERFDRVRRAKRPVLTALIPFILLLGSLGPKPAAADEKNGFFMSENSDVKKGNGLLKAGKIGEALKAYQAATRALPGKAAVHLDRGLAIARSGDEKQIDQAMQAFKTATDTEGSDAVRGRAHFNLGNMFFKKEDYAEAIRQYKKSLMLAPGNKDAAWNLELAKLKKKEKDEQQKKDQENKDQQKQDSDQDQQDQQDQDQDQQKQDQDQQKQNQDQQDQQKQEQKEEQKKEEKKKQEQKKEEEKQQQQQEQQQKQQPKSKQEVEQMLNSLDNQDDSLQKQMAKQRARGLRGMPRKDW